MKRDYQLLTILQSHAPDNEAQVLMTVIYNQMKEDNLSGIRIETELATMLSNGLNHGNWPWVIRNLTVNSIRL